MKKLLCVALCSIAGSAYAQTSHLNAKSNNNFYIGAQVGYADSTYKQKDVEPQFHATKLDHTGFVGRLNAGYLLSSHFALEAGAMLLPHIKWSTTGGDMTGESRYLIDVFGKAILPLQNNFNIFGKAGLAWYHQEKRYAETSATDNGWIPAVGIGSSYSLNSQLSVDLSYNYYLKKGKKENISDADLSGHYFAATHFMSIGLNYCFSA